MGDDNNSSSQVDNSEPEVLKDNITEPEEEKIRQTVSVIDTKRQYIVYCGICSAPPEYCAYNSLKIQSRCLRWLNDNHLPLYNKIYAKSLEDMLKDLDIGDEKGETSSTSTTANKQLEGSSSICSEENDDNPEDGKKSKKKSKRGGGLKPIKSLDSEDTGGPINITTQIRNKKKKITMVAGLDTYTSIKLKDVSKALGKKFATGASISTEAGKQVIVIQGEVPFETSEFLVSKFNVPEENIIIEE